MSWQPDSESSSCTLCSEAFTFFNRKHHCRKCGKLVCGACSGHFPVYPLTTLVLHGDRAPTKPSPLGQYRTCETCALEIERDQRNGGETAGLYAGRTKSIPQENHIKNGVALSGASSGVTELGGTGLGAVALSGDAVGSTAVGSTEENEEDFCPVCGTNLLQRFKGQTDCTEWETYKEGHVSECITSFDFASDHLRLSSPPGAQASRNRMLVYNIPPIPRPSYEPIRGSEPIQKPHSVPEAEGEYGSMTSNATVTLEKEPSDNECVICLEDLKPGDKVGRLECLCVFHYICIKNWFNKKSFAECPIHFLHR